MQTQIIILAAGKGKRMGESELPKVLIPLKGRPLIMPLLDQVVPISPRPPVIVVGFKRSDVISTLGNKYTYAFQKDQLGTAHAVWCAKPKITAKNILVLYGDMPFIKASSLKKLIALHQGKEAMVSMFTAFAPNFNGPYASLNNFGRIIRDSYNNIVKITEYKDATDEEQKIKEVNPGIYMFNVDWLWQNIDQIDNKNAQQEFYLTDIVEVAMRDEQPIYSIPISPKEVLGINTQVQLDQASKLLS